MCELRRLELDPLLSCSRVYRTSQRTLAATRRVADVPSNTGQTLNQMTGLRAPVVRGDRSKPGENLPGGYRVGGAP